ISNITPSAVLHYTTTGVDPTESDPVITSGATVVAGNYTLKARAYLAGWTSSDTKTAVYSLTGPLTNWAVAGGSHTVALKRGGRGWTLGPTASGQLGDAGPSRSTAAIVNGVTGVVAVAAGTNHTLALRTDGTVLSWGYNASGQLGDNTTTSRSAFAPV